MVNRLNKGRGSKFFIGSRVRQTPEENHQISKSIGNRHHQPGGGACGVVVIVVGNEHGDSSSNPGRE